MALTSNEKLFDSMFEEVLQSIYSKLPEELSVATGYFEKMAKYNVPHGKKTRGRTLVGAFQTFSERDCSIEDLKLACVAGWCVEWLQAGYLVEDDIMDESETRRGQQCWYLTQRESLGLISINDGIHLLQCVPKILKLHFRGKPYYADLLDLFNDCSFNTIYGQCMDMITSPNGRNFDDYTEERYWTIIKWKTAFYSFYLPVAAGMILAGVTDEEKYKTSEKILLKMGEYFQVQDDYLDCFGDPEIMGKIGRDIEDAKCSWLFVKAMGRASEQEREILKKNYGIDDSAKVETIKSMYRELDIQKAYADYENDVYDEIMAMIKTLCPSVGLSTTLFIELTNKIFKRNK